MALVGRPTDGCSGAKRTCVRLIHPPGSAGRHNRTRGHSAEYNTTGTYLTTKTTALISAATCAASHAGGAFQTPLTGWPQTPRRSPSPSSWGRPVNYVSWPITVGGGATPLDRHLNPLRRSATARPPPGAQRSSNLFPEPVLRSGALPSARDTQLGGPISYHLRSWPNPAMCGFIAR